MIFVNADTQTNERKVLAIRSIDSTAVLSHISIIIYVTIITEYVIKYKKQNEREFFSSVQRLSLAIELSEGLKGFYVKGLRLGGFP